MVSKTEGYRLGVKSENPPRSLNFVFMCRYNILYYNLHIMFNSCCRPCGSNFDKILSTANIQGQYILCLILRQTKAGTCTLYSYGPIPT